MSYWDEKTPTDIMDDINAILQEAPRPTPDCVLMPFSTWYALKRLFVRDWLKTRKRNKRRPAFATAWNGRP